MYFSSEKDPLQAEREHEEEEAGAGPAVTRAAAAASAGATAAIPDAPADPLMAERALVAKIKINAMLPAVLDGQACFIRIDKKHKKGAEFTVGVCKHGRDQSGGEKVRATKRQKMALADIKNALMQGY